MISIKDKGKYVEIDTESYGGNTILGSRQNLIYGVLEDITDAHYVLRPSATVEVEFLNISDIIRQIIKAKGNRAPKRRLVNGRKNLIAHLDQNKELVLSKEVVGNNICLFGDVSFKRNYGINFAELP